MVLIGKLVIDVEIQSPGDLFLEIFSTKKYDLPRICPDDDIQSIQLLTGHWGAVGGIVLTHFFVGKIMLFFLIN